MYRSCATIICLTLNFIINNDAVAIFNKFATKNTYKASNSNLSELNTQRNDLENCEPVLVILVARHGIRYPGSDDIEAGPRIASELRRQGADSAIVNELEAVMNRDLPKEKSNQLSRTGAEEHREFGFRLAGRYSQLYSSAKHDEVLFVSSSSARAFDSCTNFQKGFIEDRKLNLSTDVKKDDRLVRFYDHCPRFVKGVRKNKTALKEYYDFLKMKNEEINENIAKQLNTSRLQITPDDLNSAYKIAACEVAVANSHHWLNIFSETNLDILEFGEDLSEYWKLGSGYPINYQQSCPLLADIFEHLDNATQGKQSKKGVFYFGHAETVVPLITLLGLFTDGDALRAEKFEQQRNRTFKTSNISPFSTNVAFVLHKCSSTAQPPQFSGSDPTFKVQVLFKEQSKLLKNVCPDNLCSYEDLRKSLAEFIDHCDFDKRCSLSGSDISAVFSELMLIITMYVIMFIF